MEEEKYLASHFSSSTIGGRERERKGTKIFPMVVKVLSAGKKKEVCKVKREGSKHLFPIFAILFTLFNIDGVVSREMCAIATQNLLSLFNRSNDPNVNARVDCVNKEGRIAELRGSWLVDIVTHTKIFHSSILIDWIDIKP